MRRSRLHTLHTCGPVGMSGNSRKVHGDPAWAISRRVGAAAVLVSIYIYIYIVSEMAMMGDCGAVRLHPPLTPSLQWMCDRYSIRCARWRVCICLRYAVRICEVFETGPGYLRIIGWYNVLAKVSHLYRELFRRALRCLEQVKPSASRLRHTKSGKGIIERSVIEWFQVIIVVHSKRRGRN